MEQLVRDFLNRPTENPDLEIKTAFMAAVGLSMGLDILHEGDQIGDPFAKTNAVLEGIFPKEKAA